MKLPDRIDIVVTPEDYWNSSKDFCDDFNWPLSIAIKRVLKDLDIEFVSVESNSSGAIINITDNQKEDYRLEKEFTSFEFTQLCYEGKSFATSLLIPVIIKRHIIVHSNYCVVRQNLIREDALLYTAKKVRDCRIWCLENRYSVTEVTINSKHWRE